MPTPPPTPLVQVVVTASTTYLCAAEGLHACVPLVLPPTLSPEADLIVFSKGKGKLECSVLVIV